MLKMVEKPDRIIFFWISGPA